MAEGLHATLDAWYIHPTGCAKPNLRGWQGWIISRSRNGHGFGKTIDFHAQADYRGGTRGKYEENTKRIGREYEENTKRIRREWRRKFFSVNSFSIKLRAGDGFPW